MKAYVLKIYNPSNKHVHPGCRRKKWGFHGRAPCKAMVPKIINNRHKRNLVAVILMQRKSSRIFIRYPAKAAEMYLVVYFWQLNKSLGSQVFLGTKCIAGIRRRETREKNSWFHLVAISLCQTWAENCAVKTGCCSLYLWERRKRTFKAGERI